MTPIKDVLGTELTALFASPRVEVERCGDDCVILRNPTQLSGVDAFAGAGIILWADVDPSRIWLAERAISGAPWTTLTYGTARDKIAAVATALLHQNLSVERPVLILSDNSIDVAILTFACHFAGIPVSSISPSFSLHRAKAEQLREMVRLINPGLVYASDIETYRAALDIVEEITGCPTVTSDQTTLRARQVPFVRLTEKEAEAKFGLSNCAANIAPHTIAKLLFTSGSTGMPKAVVLTHRNLCATTQSMRLCWPFQTSGEQLNILEWLPWSHSFGSKNLLLSTRNGWSFYIDKGRPTPTEIGTTIANLKDVRPGLHNNVPLGYDMLLGAMSRDDGLAEAFFSNMKLIFYAGAALSEATWNGLQKIATRIRGYPIPIISQWGATETGPTSTDSFSQDPRHLGYERCGNVGVPVPGTELKLVRSADKWEARVRGPSVTQGYLKNPAATADAFDEEGFYKVGDALRFADERNPLEGLFFDGRIAEDFKLSSGTWVRVGELRLRAISALAPAVTDLVVTGHDRNEIGLLLFPNEAACREMAGLTREAPLEDVVRHPLLMSHIKRGLQHLFATGGGASRYATRARLLNQPPDVSVGEITDKGSINQRAVLRNRQRDLAALYGNSHNEWIGLE